MSAVDLAQGLWLLVAVVGLALPVVVAGLPVAGAGAFVAVGGYATALLGPGGLGWPLGLAAVAAVGLGTVAGLALGWGAARLEGGSLGLATWAAGWAADAALRGFPSVTGGDRGLVRGTPARLVSPALGASVALTPRWCCALAGACVVAVTAGAARLARGPLGRELAAVRAGAPLAATLGVPVTAVRAAALALAAGCAASAGAGLLTSVGVVSPADVSPLLSLQLLVAVLVVPRATWWAPLAGGVVVGGGLLVAERLAGLLGADPGRLRGVATALGLAAVLALRAHGRARRPGGAELPVVAPAVPDVRHPRAVSGAPALDATGLRVAFGGLRALDGVDLVLRPGEVHALVGPNGSGKTTLLRVLAGTLAPDAGEVRVDGRPATRGTSSRLRAGVARTPQPTVLLPGLDAAAQVEAAVARAGGRRPGTVLHLLATPRSRVRREADAAAAAVALRRCRLPAWGDPATWPSGAQRRLQVARAVATGARVLLLDEPAAGMTAGERAELAAVLRGLAADGCAVVLVEHDMALVSRVADRVTVLAAGRVVAAGTPAEVRGDDEVVRRYLGAAS